MSFRKKNLVTKCVILLFKNIDYNVLLKKIHIFYSFD
jgi:hypothetical protein